MIVGFISNTCEPFYRGGYERRVWSFARELVRQGHEVRIFTSCPSDQTIESVRFVRLAAPRRYFNQRGVRNGVADLLFACGLLRLLWKLRRSELDIIDVGATPFLHLPVATFIARLKKIPMALTCHEALLSNLPDYVRERGYRSRIIRGVLIRMLAGIYRLGMKMSARRIAVSQRTADGLVREEFPAEAVVEFGLEAEAFARVPPEMKSGPVRFIFCGRLTPIKNVDQSLQALLSLREQGQPFHFDVIGEGSEADRLRFATESAAAGDCITFHGEISEQAKRHLLSRAEVFILSSPREGFSIATLEAMAQGCCALVVSDPRWPSGALDFVHDGEAGICIAPGVELMRRTLAEMLGDPSGRLALRQTAWKKAFEYRIETQTTRLLQYYTSIKAR